MSCKPNAPQLTPQFPAHGAADEVIPLPSPQIVYTNTTTDTMRIQSIDGVRLAYPLVLEPGESVTAEQVPPTIQAVGAFTMRLEYDE